MDYGSRGGEGKNWSGSAHYPELAFQTYLCTYLCTLCQQKAVGKPYIRIIFTGSHGFFSYRRMAEEGQWHEPHAARRSTAGALRMAEDEQI